MEELSLMDANDLGRAMEVEPVLILDGGVCTVAPTSTEAPFLGELSPDEKTSSFSSWVLPVDFNFSNLSRAILFL